MKTKAILALCGSVLVGGFMPAGCERPPSEAAAQAPAPSAHDSDAAISARVKARLAADSELLPLPISVETAQGKVTLRGVVPQALIGRAAQVVGRVDGVRAVDNRLEPPATS